MKKLWEDFWYEWSFPQHFRYGGSDRARKVLKKQRLFNVIIIIIIIILIILQLNH